MNWYRPTSLAQTLDLLADGTKTIVAGGTDLFVTPPRVRDWVDPGEVGELRHIWQDPEGIHIGAFVTATMIRTDPRLTALTALVEAASMVGGWQIQNRATLGGNIVNASPAADMVVPLMAYDAGVTMQSVRGTRRLALGEFIGGPKRVHREADEILTSVDIPRRALASRQRFMRMDQRAASDISLVSVAMTAECHEGRVLHARIAVGAANPVPFTLASQDAFLAGTVTIEALVRVAKAYRDGCQPVSDLRASREYRQALVESLITRIGKELLIIDPS